jgi:hypothetical protein
MRGQKQKGPPRMASLVFGKTPLLLEYQVQVENEPSILACK